MPLGPRDVLTASESAFAASMFDILTSTFLESSLRKKERKKEKTKERKKESVKNEKLIEQRDHLKNEKLLFSTRRKGRRKRKRKKREERRRKGEEENRQSSSLSLVLETHTHTRSRLARGPPRSTEVNQVIPRRGRSNPHHQKRKEKDEERNRFLQTLVCSLSLTHSLSLCIFT